MSKDILRSDTKKVFSRGFYCWTALGLLVMTGAAWLTAQTFDALAAALEWWLLGFWGGAFVAVVVLAFYLRKKIWTLNKGKAGILLIVSALLSGLFFSVPLLGHSNASIAQVLLPTAGMFVLMSLYTRFTEHSGVLAMGLFGAIIAVGIKLFMGTSWAAFALGILEVLIFLGLTAWAAGHIGADEDSNPERAAAVGALGVFYGLFWCLLFWILICGIFTHDED